MVLGLREFVLAMSLAAAPAAMAATQANPDGAAPLEQIAADQVVAVLGVTVRGPGGTEVGRIVDVLVDSAGQPRAAVVDAGGFLGVGGRRVALGWRSLRFSLGKTPVAVLAMPTDRLKSAPAYDPDKPVEIIDALPPAPSPPAASPPAAK